ncbi:hypothetical protein C8R47DRAFT_1077665 [Mycena vitilis]|nr:hypothetical protein C8R47DRAFT_1077665 [Mycena vitilis]
MFPTRARAIFSSQLRRQTTVPRGSGGSFDPKTPTGQNNMLLAAAAGVTVIGWSYYMGYWGMEAKGRRSNFGPRVELIDDGDCCSKDQVKEYSPRNIKPAATPVSGDNANVHANIEFRGEHSKPCPRTDVINQILHLVPTGFSRLYGTFATEKTAKA